MTPGWTRWICLAWLLLIPFSGNTATPMVSLGPEHALALLSNGTVVAWGSDQFGKLGTGRSLDVPTPTIVPGLPAMKGIAGGGYHSLAIGQDGTVWTWGSNSQGQLGDGTTTDRTSPVRVPGMGNAVMACGGTYFSVVLKQDGTLWSWGALYNGSQTSPAQIAGLTGIASVACGGGHFIALRQDSTVWAWGSNEGGQLGDGTINMRLQPVQVPGLTNVAGIGAGGSFSAALKQDGTVWEWGLVISTGAIRLSPVQSLGVSGAVKMRVGANNLAAIKADGTTWWLWESGTTPAIQNSVGSLNSVVPEYTMLLLKSDGTVLVGNWTPLFHSSPVPVDGLSNIAAIAAGSSHSLALDATGNVWAWGSNSSGQLGLGVILSSSFPVAPAGLSNIVQVSAGVNHSLAVDQGGSVWAWGSNQGGQLGDGTSTDRSAPIRLTSIANVQAVAAGFLYSLALKRDGTVWTWGSGPSGALGNLPPSQVPGLSGVVAIAAGAGHSLALTQGGSVWAWGANNSGQLGFGTVSSTSVPVQVPGLSGVRSVAASTSSYAVKTDGTVMAWGGNQYGTLGDGSTTDRHSPVPVTGLTAVVEIAAGGSHVLARRADGTVWGWGINTSGELGVIQNPLFPLQPTAALIGGVSAIQQISAGNFVSTFVRQDGLIQMGGSNRTGQSGDGTYAQHQSFVLVVNASVNGFLNLYPGTTVNVPTNLNVPFFLATYFNGSLRSTTLYADLRGITASGTFASSDLGQFAAGYDVYVAANVPTILTSPYFQLNANNSWTTLNWPISAFLSGVALDSQTTVVRAQVLQNADLSSPVLAGTSIIVGYGTDPDEMLRSARYRTIFTVPSQ